MDKIDNPQHYKLEDGSEVKDHIRSILGDQGYIEYCRGNIFKYVSRYNTTKNLDDLEKAKKYIDFIIETTNTQMSAPIIIPDTLVNYFKEDVELTKNMTTNILEKAIIFDLFDESEINDINIRLINNADSDSEDSISYEVSISFKDRKDVMEVWNGLSLQYIGMEGIYFIVDGNVYHNVIRRNTTYLIYLNNCKKLGRVININEEGVIYYEKN